MLEALRLVCSRQFEQHDHPLLFEILSGRGFIELERRLRREWNSQGPWFPVDVAIVSLHGRAALDWLSCVARSPQWAQRQSASYGD
jgi:hypothetical protein